MPEEIRANNSGDETVTDIAAMEGLLTMDPRTCCVFKAGAGDPEVHAGSDKSGKR